LAKYFDGKNNDANILIHGLKTNAEDMSNWLREGDIVVVDRGFRDSVEFLNDLIVTFPLKMKLNFSEYKSMCRPEREWLGLHDPQIRY
jgi:hypothetical protein